MAGVGSGNAAWYRAELGSAWEEGWGLATAGSPEVLTRNVVRSSNGNALVNWVAGAKRIYGCLLSDALRFGAAGQVPTAAGTANARTLAFAPPCRVLRPGMVFRFVNGAAANAGAVTLAVDGLPATPIRRGTAELAAGDLAAGALITALFDGVNFRLASVEYPDAGTARAALGLGAFTEATREAPLPIPHNTVTTITWQAAARNDLAAWAAVAPQRLTVPAGASRVRVSARASWGGSGAVSERHLMLLRNGVEERRASLATTSLGIVTEQEVGSLFAVTPGEFFEAQCLQSTGAVLNILVANGTGFTMEVVR